MFRDPIPVSQPLAQARTYSSDTVQQFLEQGGGIVLFAIVLCAIIFLGWRS